MSLIKCEVCGTEVSDTAVSCPKCGDNLKIKRNVKSARKALKGCLIVFLIVFFGLAGIITISIFSTKKSDSQQEVQKEYYLGDIVNIGDLGYCVLKTKKTDSIGSQRADSSFLILDLFVVNSGKKPKIVQNFALIDQKGKVYSESGSGIFLDRYFGLIKILNPGVNASGEIAFDVPRGNTYKLVVQEKIALLGNVTQVINLKKNPYEIKN